MWRYWLLCELLWAQSLIVEPSPHGLAIAPFLHSYGWGLGVYVARWKTPKQGMFWMGDITSYRTKYEGRIRSAYRDQGGKDYVFGKIYYAYLLEVLFGYQRTLVSRTVFSPFQVNLQGGIGPAFALLKPYYIEVARPISSTQAIIQVDTYDPTRHSYYDIIGEADFYLGFDKLRTVPGLAGQVGIAVDIGKDASLIRMLALGVRVQGFVHPVQTLYQRSGKSLWTAGYMAFYIGNGWK